MKNVAVLLHVIIVFILNGSVKGQSAPIWTQSMNTLPDSSYLFPAKTCTDANNNIYVLSTYTKHNTPSGTVNKIYLNKYNYNGSLIWSLVYDSISIGQPRGFDMAVTDSGDCFIAGGFVLNPNFKTLLLKVNSTGNVAWQMDSLTAFHTGFFNQIFLKGNLLYLASSAGIGVVDTTGNEKWSLALNVERMAVDNKGQMIVSAFTASNSIFRYDSSGVLNFSDSTIVAARIAIDSDNNIYLLTDFSSYELVKYSNQGVFQWSKNSFPIAPPFGDIGFDVIADLNNDVIVIGLNDTMVKFNPAGTMLWTKSMNGLDSYRLTATIFSFNLLFICGTVIGAGGGNNLYVASFDLLGNQNWSGSYNSNNIQEFSADMVIDNSGVYVIEDSVSNTLLVKFELPFFTLPIDYSLICVDSVWYDSINPGYINVRVFNGNISHMNYPTIRIVSPAGDTISNVSNQLNFFAHLGNDFQVYNDSIIDLSITDFSNYTFVMGEGSGVSSGVIDFCLNTGIASIDDGKIILYPNPVRNDLSINGLKENEKYTFEIYDSGGRLIKHHSIKGEEKTVVEFSDYNSGLYFIRLINEKVNWSFRIVKYD